MAAVTDTFTVRSIAVLNIYSLFLPVSGKEGCLSFQLATGISALL
jgi:hypothetical protein